MDRVSSPRFLFSTKRRTAFCTSSVEPSSWMPISFSDSTHLGGFVRAPRVLLRALSSHLESADGKRGRAPNAVASSPFRPPV